MAKIKIKSKEKEIKKIAAGSSYRLLSHIKYKNKVYPTLTALASDIGMKYTTLMYRLNKGMSLEEACSKNVMRKIEIIVDNIKFKSLCSACNHFKINRATAEVRLKTGWTPDEAFEVCKLSRNTECKGKLYRIRNEVNNIVYIGITTKSLKSRFRQHKWSASNYSNTNFHKAVREIGQEKFHIELIKEVNDLYKLRSLEIKYINKYLSKNRSYNTSSGGCNLGRNRGNPVIFKNKVYLSMTDLADHLGVNRSTIARRLKKDIPFDAPLKVNRYA